MMKYKEPSLYTSDIQPGVSEDMLGVGKIKKKKKYIYIYMKKFRHLINRSEPHQLVIYKTFDRMILLCYNTFVTLLIFV
jgi:hypothetical protein